MFFGVFVATLFSVSVEGLSAPSSPDEDLPMKSVITKCFKSNNGISCFADTIARGLEKSMGGDVPLLDGIQLLRNGRKLEDAKENTPHSSNSSRLSKTLADFLDTHTLSVDFTEDGDEQSRSSERRPGGALGFGTKRISKRERRYMQYAFTVLLGIFGLTGPLVMKTLAVMAAKALIASKVALLIVGSVALKKIFDKQPQQPSVKVHTIELEDDHDRSYVPKRHWSNWNSQPQAFFQAA